MVVAVERGQLAPLVADWLHWFRYASNDPKSVFAEVELAEVERQMLDVLKGLHPE